MIELITSKDLTGRTIVRASVHPTIVTLLLDDNSIIMIETQNPEWTMTATRFSRP